MHDVLETGMLKKIECYIRPSKLDRLQDVLLKKGVEGLSVLDARGVGARNARVKGRSPLELRTKLEIVVDESIVDAIVDTIRTLAGAGEIGAGKIFVLPVEDALRISTSEAGKRAIF